MIKQISQKYSKELYFIFRVLIGLMFLQHGIQKIFGGLGGQQVEIMSLMGLAGLIELIAGALITVGLFTREAASIAALEMLIALIKAHFPQGWIPITNGGETAILYFAAFLAIMIYGAQKCGFDLIGSNETI